ncbi:hypothetical protein BX667DRAFT_373280 [Coemansia mojavensis]|nr:hypothetical protein BX667DRAFT_373280 [Coemansia mojavensis]
MSSNDPAQPPGNAKQSNAPRRKPAKRSPRAFVEEPLYLLPAHYVLLQDSTYELMRGLAGLSTAVEDDPLYFDQLLGAAVNVKHAFDLGRMDVINGTIRPRNTSLCHECITTVSSVWRSGPEGPRTLCNACGLRFYKQNQRRALEARRREMREAAANADDSALTPDSQPTPSSSSSSSSSSNRMADADEDTQQQPADMDMTRFSPELTRPSIANLCDPPANASSRHTMSFIPSISNILASPAQTPEPSKEDE